MPPAILPPLEAAPTDEHVMQLLAGDWRDKVVDELERAPAWHADCGSPVCPGPHIDPPGWPRLPRLRP